MIKYNTLIVSIINLNYKLQKEIYEDIYFDYVLYKDFQGKGENKLLLNQNHIKIIKLSSKIEKINIDFNGGYDYAEDWANPLYEISQFVLNTDENIVIHLCDAGAHGKRFSDYCNKNDQENLLIQALKFCSEKKVKIIGLLINDYARKSFLECQRLYKQFNGYYNLLDLTRTKLDENNFFDILIENIYNAFRNIENINFKNINDFILNEEEEFLFYINKKEGEYRTLKMKKLIDIEKYKNISFNFLPNKGIKQGTIGDCYLISSILSIATQFPKIYSYIFPHLDYNEKSEFIEMYYYNSGIKNLVCFKNTYPADEEDLFFAKPLDNELSGIALEKGYAISKSDGKKIGIGYNNISGGFAYQAFEIILGAKSEKYYYNNINKNKLKKYGYKQIKNKDILKNKIKKYIDFGGVIAFGVVVGQDQGHEYSIQDYKIKNKKLYLEIINPHRSGKYEEEHILNKERPTGKDEYNYIYKSDFDDDNDSKYSFKNYKNTGYLLMKFETFLKWFKEIDMCDPMFGSYEETIEFLPFCLYKYDFEIKNKTKFRAFLIINKGTKEKNEDEKKEIIYKLKLEDNNGDLINKYDYENNSEIIYEFLEKGKYTISIEISQKINEIIYLKIQNYDVIKEDLSNNIIINVDENSNNRIYNLIYTQMNFINEFFQYFLDIFKEKNIIYEFYNKPSINSIYNSNYEYITRYNIGIIIFIFLIFISTIIILVMDLI